MNVDRKNDESYKSRSGKIGFMAAINRMAQKTYGITWIDPTAEGGPMILPKTRELATQVQLYYAAAVLTRIFPSMEFTEIADVDDSIPSYARRDFSDLDIGEELWSMARDEAEFGYFDEASILEKLKLTLNDFATRAYEGRIKCFAHEETTRSEEPIEACLWEVDEAALLRRYWSSSLERKRNDVMVRHLILVDESSLLQLQPSQILDIDQRKIIVRSNLKDAMDFNENFSPYGHISILRMEVSKYLECSIHQAREFIDTETNKCWSKRGAPSRIAAEKGNPIKIGMKRD